MKTSALISLLIGGMAIEILANTPPVIAPIPDVVTTVGVAVEGIPIRISDAESVASELAVRAVSSNVEAVPQSGLLWSGAGEVRGLTIRLAPGRWGIVTITVEARDPQGLTGRQTFRLTTQPELPRLTVDAILPQRGWQGGPTLRIPISFKWHDSADGNLSVSATASPSNLLASSALLLTPDSGANRRMLWISMPLDRAGAAQVKIVARRSGVTAEASFPLIVERARMLPDSVVRLPPALERAPRLAVDWDGFGEMDFVAGGTREIQVWTYSALGYAIRVRAPFEVTTLEVGVVDFDGDGHPDVVARGPNEVGLWRGWSTGGSDGLERVPLPSAVAGVVIRGMIWRDFDADGDVDAMLFRATGTVLLTRETQGWNVQNLAGKPPGWPAAAADADGDGDVDLLASTSRSAADANSSSGIWWNDGRGRFATNGPPILNGVVRTLGWEDFDGDGRPDPWFLQTNPSGDRLLTTYRQIPGGWLESGCVTTLAGDTASFAWGDLDADGVPDGMVPTVEGPDRTYLQTVITSEWVARMFRGTGDGALESFSGYRTEARAPAVTLLPTTAGSLDLAIGRSLMRNRFQGFNPPPGSPSGLRSWVSGKRIRLSWLDAWDLNQAGGLTYNVRAGTRPGSDDVISALSRPDGGRKVAAHGNAGGNSFLELDLSRIPAGPLYWSVQAIDASYAGGTFAEEQTIANFPQDADSIVTLDLVAYRVASGFFFTRISGMSVPPRPLLIETSSDLGEWRPVRWIQPQPGGQFSETYPNLDPGGGPMRFFRARVADPSEAQQ